MTIDILANDGSPIGVVSSDVFGSSDRVGVGGAELALFTMCEAWSRRGDTVRLYNNPRRHEDTLEQLPLDAFDSRYPRDALIVFRSPNDRIDGAKGLKVWWSHDTRTVGDFRTFATRVDRLVLNSHFHQQYFAAVYGITNSVVIDLAVRTSDYTSDATKDPLQLLYCSVPNRGLDIVAKIWPLIQRELTGASLVVTSDFRLWGSQHPGSESYVKALHNLPGVTLLGAVPRRRLIQEQLRSAVLMYPSTFSELFCIAVAEAQVCGTLPITSAMGALSTTNMGLIVNGNPRDCKWQSTYVSTLLSALCDPQLSELQSQIRTRAMARFNIASVLEEWDKRIFS